MNLQDIEKALSEMEQKLSGLLAPVGEKQVVVNKLNEVVKEVDVEYNARIQQMHEERNEAIKKYQDEQYELKSEIFKIQSEAGTVESATRSLREQHAQALKDIAAEQRLKEIYAKIADFFEDSPWSAHIKEFQKEDILAIVSAYEEGKAGILNANVMGAGKTFEVGAVYDILRTLFYKKHGRQPLTIWLTRKSLMKSTAEELLQWNPDRKFIPVDGNAQVRENMLNIAVISNLPIIVNYEFLNSTPRALEIEWDFVIVDECHKLKGGDKVKAFHHTKTLTDKSRFFLGLSGSPIQNKPEDIWPIFNILDEYRFPSVRRFQREFVREVWDEKLLRFVTKADEERLINVMKGQVIKQDPKVVQASWPSKRRIFKVVEMGEEQRKVYRRVKQGIIDYFTDEAETNPNKTVTITAIIAQLTYLRQVNVWPGGVSVKDPNGTSYTIQCQESAKLDAAVDLIEEMTGEGEQVVLWSAQFNEPLKEIARRLDADFPELTYRIMFGETSSRSREYEEEFQAGKIDVLLCNRSAVSEGFNFQKNPGRWLGGASKAIFLDAWWNPKANEQAEDRIWRTGQSDNVDIYYIYTDDSVDAFISAKLDEKEAMIKGIMDSEQLRPKEVIGLLEELL